MRHRLLIIGVVLLSVASVAFGTDFAIVVNPSNPVRQLTLAELAKVFRAKTTAWPDRKGITIVLRDPSAPGSKFIIEKVLGGTVEDGKAILTDPARKTIVPVVFAQSDDEVVKIVAGNAGAIGVIDVYNITGGVKVVKSTISSPLIPATP